jgi:PAS domain S-box-containing protein
LLANEAAALMFGYAADEMRALNRESLVDTSDQRLAPALDQRRRTGRFRGELTMRRKDGTTFAVELSSAIFSDEEGREFTSMVIREVPEGAARPISEFTNRWLPLEMQQLTLISGQDGHLASRLVTFIEALFASDALTDDQKLASAQVFREIVETGTERAKGRRTRAAVTHLLDGFSRIVAPVPELASLWENVEADLTKQFSQSSPPPPTARR